MLLICGMFSKCHKLKDIKGINKFKTSNVKYMNAMFDECKEIKCRKIRISAFIAE